MLPTLFAITLFVGAALLFLVQPLVGKLLLPLVGGTPGVWNTCMVFFQAVLLAGYLYAHRSTRRLGVRKQAAFHLFVLGAMVIAFKVALAGTGSPVPVVVSLLPDDHDYPIVGVVALVGVAVGVPFFVLSTTSPLLQRWFASTGHPSARDPYFLYAASNAGSLLGLLAYPLLIEPRLTLTQQQWVFAGGVFGYTAMVVACALVVLRKPAAQVESATGNSPKPDRWRVVRWVVLAALPSSLLLGVTTHVSTDLAPVPLLWVMPLALYLVSFILVFARWPDSVHRAVGRITPILILFVVLTLLTHAAEPFALVGLLHLSAFFGVCLVCHGELAKDRPPPEHLTAFYFWMSLGGVLGGLFNALVAPMLFHKVGMVEYPLALVLAALVRPRGEEQTPILAIRIPDVSLVLYLLAFSVALVLAVPYFITLPTELDSPDALVARLLRGGLMFGIPAALAFTLVRKPARYALALSALLVAGAFDSGLLGETLHMERNFFGVVRVTRSPDGKFVRLIHGTTMHGQQRADEPGPPRPMTYYHQRGPVGHLFAALPVERVRKVGVVGLGTGAVASYAKPGQEWTFFEIDPAVVRIANDPAYFRFLSSCKERGVPCEMVLGDARRQLARVPDNTFDVIIIDFCSDAIPVHLLTREALRLYVSKLTPNGVLAMHISNNHLDLRPLIARLAADHAPPLHVRYCHDSPFESERADGKTDSQWMLVARSESDLEPILNPSRKLLAARRMTWEKVQWEDGPLWRDDFANLLRVWKKRDQED
ncbi:MAG: fused MFS/spermidine synthase [Planctomycetia bacterium]|nr:fused MFS/spermidine synthase [Planctomycetia bacterium]